MMVLYAHVYAPPPRLTAARPDLPAGADAVLTRGMEKPRNRYDTCGDFADALREALGFEPYESPGARGARPTFSGVPIAAPAPPGQDVPTQTLTMCGRDRHQNRPPPPPFLPGPASRAAATAPARCPA